jgi:hypothetical protein
MHLISMILVCCCSARLYGETDVARKQGQEDAPSQTKINSYLLPKHDPLYKQIPQLLHNPDMFKSPRHFEKAGFTVKRGHRKLMVGFHPFIPHHLIKKFSDKMPQAMQLENYIKRIKGAEILRNYIHKHHYTHLVVPEKWLYKLPKKFSKKGSAYLLIVENMDIYDDWEDPNGEARQLYYNMDKETLTELCTILHDVGGCDAYPWNQPFTRSGKIAFVDTEHVGKRKFHDYFIKHIVPALNEELQAYALALWAKLEEEDH